MVENNRLFSWLKLWHPSKKSITGDVADGSSYTQQHHHGNQRLRHALVKYGKRGWVPHWNLLRLDKRSCAQTRDIRTDGPRQNQDHKQGTLRSLPVPPMGDKCSTQRKLQTSLSTLDEKMKESITLKVNVGTGVSRRGVCGDPDIATGVDLQLHKSAGLKNRVLPLTVQEDVHFSTAFNQKATNLFSVDEENPISVAAKGAELEALKRTGSISFKKLGFSRVSSTPVSPRSPSEIKWKMLLSCSSQSGSPRSPRCFHQPEWTSPHVDSTHQKGSFSTMGSPWNSQAGGYRVHSTRTSSFKGSYKQGQWITTDTDFVVLEL
eukprot:c19391_g1_i1 orf=173-1132(+)